MSICEEFGRHTTSLTAPPWIRTNRLRGSVSLKCLHWTKQLRSELNLLEISRADVNGGDNTRRFHPSLADQVSNAHSRKILKFGNYFFFSYFFKILHHAQFPNSRKQFSASSQYLPQLVIHPFVKLDQQNHFLLNVFWGHSGMLKKLSDWVLPDGIRADSPVWKILMPYPYLRFQRDWVRFRLPRCATFGLHFLIPRSLSTAWCGWIRKLLALKRTSSRLWELSFSEMFSLSPSPSGFGFKSDGGAISQLDWLTRNPWLHRKSSALETKILKTVRG
jgi:hypothetical protein